MTGRGVVAAVLASLAVTAAVAAGGQHQVVSFQSLDGTVVPAYLVRPHGPMKGTVIALHGCGGLYALQGPRRGNLLARNDAMAELLQSHGYAVLFPDSFMARGEVELCTQKLLGRRIGYEDRGADALAAMAWVAGQPWARGDRIALLGWSHGGNALLAATNATDDVVRANPHPPKAAIAFYPGCNAALRANYQPAVPLTLMLGEKDDWTPAAPCIELGSRAKAEVNVFPGSYHDFDNPNTTVRLRTDVPNGANPGKGVHVGGNAAAREAAYRRLLEVLAKAFG